MKDKILKTLTEGITFKTVEIEVYKITVKNDPTRCYTIDVRKHPTCTCPEFLRIQTDREKQRSNAVCKHISVMCLCLGFKPSSEIVRRYTYNATERIYLDLKISTFSHQNVDIEKIKSTFENEYFPTVAAQEQELPYFDSKKYYGQFKSYEEAKLFITEQRERFPCKWYGLTYEEKRYKCTSGHHQNQESRRLRHKLTPARPLVFLVHYTRIYLNKNTEKFSARDEKKYFHMKEECVLNFGSDLSKFTNIQPPFDVDISRLSTQNSTFVRKSIPGCTFVENAE